MKKYTPLLFSLFVVLLVCSFLVYDQQMLINQQCEKEVFSFLDTAKLMLNESNLFYSNLGKGCIIDNL